MVSGEQRARRSGWIVVSPEDEPLVTAHVEDDARERQTEHDERYEGDDWRAALTWTRSRAANVFIRFDHNGHYYWAGDGQPPALHDGPPPPLPERPVVPVDEWIEQLRALRRRIAELEGTATDEPDGSERSAVRGRDLDELQRALEQAQLEGAEGFSWTMRSFQVGAVEQIRIGCTDLHRTAGFWAALLGGRPVRAAIAGRVVDGALAVQDNVRPELAFTDRQAPRQAQLTLEVDQLDAAAGRARDLGGRVLERGAEHVLIEDPEGNRALLRPAR